MTNCGNNKFKHYYFNVVIIVGKTNLICLYLFYFQLYLTNMIKFLSVKLVMTNCDND